MATDTETSKHDVVVVGARCAGAATARLLAARGHDVALVERGDLTSDPLSTHGLVRGGVVQLARWGLLDDVLASGAFPSRSMTFGVEGRETTRPIKEAAGVDLLVAPRRTVLDRIMLNAAVREGAAIQTSTQVTGVVSTAGGRVSGVRTRTRRGTNTVERTLLARHVVGADGLRSSMAGHLGARTQQAFTTDVATFYLYVDEVPWTGYELHVADSAYAGVFPTNGGQACVWLCQPVGRAEDIRCAGSRRPEALVAAISGTAPGLGARLRDGRIASGVRGVVGPPNYLREACGPGWSLVGDAGYHRDPMTGHGITDAFRDAELLATAVDAALRDPFEEACHLRQWQHTRDTSSADVFRITRALSRFPAVPRFLELQLELSEALDREAQMLASLPIQPSIRGKVPVS